MAASSPIHPAALNHFLCRHWLLNGSALSLHFTRSAAALRHVMGKQLPNLCGFGVDLGRWLSGAALAVVADSDNLSIADVPHRVVLVA